MIKIEMEAKKGAELTTTRRTDKRPSLLSILPLRKPRSLDIRHLDRLLDWRDLLVDRSVRDRSSRGMTLRFGDSNLEILPLRTLKRAKEKRSVWCRRKVSELEGKVNDVPAYRPPPARERTPSPGQRDASSRVSERLASLSRRRPSRPTVKRERK